MPHYSHHSTNTHWALLCGSIAQPPVGKHHGTHIHTIAEHECLRGCGQLGALVHCWWQYKISSLLENNTTGPRNSCSGSCRAGSVAKSTGHTSLTIRTRTTGTHDKAQASGNPACLQGRRRWRWETLQEPADQLVQLPQRWRNLVTTWKGEDLPTMDVICLHINTIAFACLDNHKITTVPTF